ncbi:sialate O-acetylesterase [Companilactobacillus halodurans]|uniref:Sialate O-acetylesterase n=1 Tax=Companilactobacillus halodurans TaxID=2584183 RepID=A0A5P0ZY64_9LACO|nr:sialate O-acetylesterase [Companilactobacillus halodurans]MQS97674.1 sialate O-acetylesterase [Companilactobacillus halodurans]
MNSVLKLDDIYTDGMVVPENKIFKISGHAIRDSKVEVRVQDKIFDTKSDSDGKWIIKIDPLRDHLTTEITINNLDESITLKSVRTGKVILLTGQSNIEFKFRDDIEYQKQIENLNLKNVYFYNVPQLEYQDKILTLPKDLKKSSWQVANENNLWEMSDIGFWTIKKLHQIDPDAIIGIIDCYKGGTSISSWVPEEILQSDQELKNQFIKPFEEAITGKRKADFDEEFNEYNAAVKKHNTDLAKFQKENPKVSLSDAKNKVGHTPWPPPMTPTSYLRPNGLFHTMIEQIQNYSFNQLVWYQGENDANNPEIYGKMLRGLILSWRKLFNDQSLPFYVIQLPGYFDEPENSWAVIRQYQLEICQTINNVHLISIADTGEKHNIHPAHKRIAGTRIGEILSNKNYNSTPYIYRHEFQNNKLILFAASANVLVQRGKAEFEILKDGHWSTQEVTIVGKLIIIQNSKEIRKVRYAFENYPKCTLFNEFGAPLAPFEMEIKKNE